MTPFTAAEPLANPSGRAEQSAASAEFTLEKMLEKVVQQVLQSGQITATERRWFYQFLLADLTLDSGMTDRVRQIFDRVRAGLIRVAD